MHQKADALHCPEPAGKAPDAVGGGVETATQIYDKLIADCNRLQDRAGDGNLKEALSEIMKDQLGMNSSLEVLKRLVKKHKDWVRDFENLPKDYTEFQDKAEKDTRRLPITSQRN